MSNERVETLAAAECRKLLNGYHFGRFAFLDSVGVQRDPDRFTGLCSDPGAVAVVGVGRGKLRAKPDGGFRSYLDPSSPESG